MNSVSPATDLHELVNQRVACQSRRGEDAEWLSTRRDMATNALLQMPMPDRKQENWRYTSTAFLERQAFQIVPDDRFEAIEQSDIEDLLLHEDTYRLVFVNGYLVPALSQTGKKGSGLSFGSIAAGAPNISDEVRDHLARIAPHRHVFEALNTSLMADGAVLHVSDHARLEKPIELLHISIGLDQPAIAHPRHLLVMGERAKAQLMERYCALGDSQYFNNSLVEIALADGSELQHQRVQEESRAAQHISDLHVRQQAGSRYQLTQASLGATWSRTDIRVEFAGPQAHAEIDALLMASDEQLTDMHLEVRHEVPGCTSRETVKGILDGKGRLVFDGHIHVARDAQQTDARLSNDNLLLSRAAEVDSKPQLEIFADDVKCSHGTTVGELDPDMLFYLRSRGIGEVQAKQMLCQGFAQQPLDAIPNDALRHRVSRQLAMRLGGRE